MGPLIAGGSRHNAPSAPIPRRRCILLPFATQTGLLRANCAFLAPTSSALLVYGGDPGGGNDGSPSVAPPSADDDGYKPLRLGVRLPRFCIKVDSNPTEIFSLSRRAASAGSLENAFAPRNFSPLSFFFRDLRGSLVAR